MHSEQLRDRLVDLLRDLAPSLAASGRVSVRQVGPGAELGSAVVAAMPAEVAEELVSRLREQPDVAGADMAPGLLRVRITDGALARSLGRDWEPPPGAILRGAERPLLPRGSTVPLSPAASRALLGDDVVAYALARAPGGGRGPLPVDVEQLVARTQRAPLFRVQHAHARAAALIARARRLGAVPVRDNDVPVQRLGADGELAASLLELPATVARALRRGEARPVPVHLEQVADLLEEVRPERRFLPVGDEEVTDGHRAGLWLVEVARRRVGRALELLGVEAPGRI